MAGDFETATGLEACALVSNLNTELASLMIGAHVLPMTRNDGIRPTNYMCCPSTAYIDYGMDELRHFSANPSIRLSLSFLLSAMRPITRASGLDRQVQFNNKLFSTCLLPDLTTSEIDEVTQMSVSRYPDHSVVWRSLVLPEQIEAFKACGYRCLPTRQVYLLDCRYEAPRRHRDEIHDARLLKKDDYILVTPADIMDGDFDRIHALYHQLYLGKYSRLNPDYSPTFFRQAHLMKRLEYYGFRNRSGVIDAFTAISVCGRHMTSPMCGYDLSLPRSLGLYRRISAFSIGYAREMRYLYHMSAGSGTFKRTRGGVAHIEYMAVQDRHLSWRKRLLIGVISLALNNIAIFLVRKYGL